MNFFSKLSKKASKTYQATKEKAVNLSEELKLKGKISDLKDKINNIYIEIGKIVYNEIKDGKDVSKEEIILKCEEISKCNEEIEKIQLEILALKKVRKCINCGEELDLEDNFCFKCGTKQPEIEKVEVKNEVAEDVKEAEVIEVNNAENSNEDNNENNNLENDNSEVENANNNLENNNSEVENTNNNEDNNISENHEEKNDNNEEDTNKNQ